METVHSKEWTENGPCTDRIYIALADTPGFFASLIRKVIKIDYVHVVLSMDADLTEAYSVGRRNPFIPLISGFEKEDTGKIVRAFPTARYKIYSLPCTAEQKRTIDAQLTACYKKRFHFHYCILGLFFLLAGKPFYQRNHYTCSSFIARLLEENHVLTFSRHFSLVTPRDFYEYPVQNVIYEGSLKSLYQSCCYYSPACGAAYES